MGRKSCLSHPPIAPYGPSGVNRGSTAEGTDVLLPAARLVRGEPLRWLLAARQLHGGASAVLESYRADRRRLHDHSATMSAVQLRRGLFPGLRLRPVYLMLAGLALEKLFEGLLVAYAGRAREQRLERLAELAEVTLTRTEHALLRDLDRFIAWSRSPDAIEPSEDRRTSAGDGGAVARGDLETEAAVIDALFERLSGLTEPLPADPR